LSAAGIWGTVLGVIVFPFSLLLAANLSRKHNVFWAAITGGGTALAHLWVTHLWQSVVLGAFSGIFLGAAAIALVPMYLQIIPRRGGLGERIGVGFAPILLSGMFAAFLAGFAYDVVVHDYRVIWIPTAVFSFGPAIALLAMKVPAHAKHADIRHGWSVLKRILWGKKEGRELFRGDIDHHEADGAALIELVADELNPYVDRGL
jgi:MFS family permease